MARYIDADKAVEEARLSYCKGCNSYNGVRCGACGFDDAMMYIEDAPTADVVEVNHGSWKVSKYVFANNGDELPIEYTCSRCGEGVHFKETNYCPNCGARMEGL